jgi:hypothetical protein
MHSCKERAHLILVLKFHFMKRAERTTNIQPEGLVRLQTQGALRLDAAN